MALDGGNYNQTVQRQPPPPVTNYAPVKPLIELKNDAKAYEGSDIVQEVRSWHNDIKQRFLDVRREIVEVGRLMANLRSGKLIMKRDPLYGGLALLKPLPYKPRGDRHVLPLAQINSTQLTSIISASQPRAVPRHFGNNQKSQIQMALIEQINEHYEAEFFHEQAVQVESLSLMDYGTTAFHVFANDNLNTIRQLQPIFENREQTVFPGHGYCKDCLFDGQPEHFKGPTPEFPQCPNCGSYNTSDMIPAQKATVATVVGQKEIKQGDIGGEWFHIPGTNWDMRKMIHDSSYKAYRSEVSQNLVRSIIGIDVEESNMDDDYGLRVMNELGSRGGSVEGLGRDELLGKPTWKSGSAVMDEEWYTPEWYAGKVTKKDEQTVSGETIPKDTPWERIWPDGICVVGFNDMQIVTSIHNEKPRITGNVYHIQSHSGYGKGTADAIEISEQLNIAHSAALATLKRFGAGGGVWYDKRAMTKTEAKALIGPAGLVGVDMRGTQYKNVNEAIGQLEIKPQNQEVLTYIAQMTNLLNIVFQTTDFTQGTADQKVDVNTLGGQQMLHAQNQQRSLATLRMRGWSRTLIFEDVIDVFRDYVVIPKFFGSNDKFSLSMGREIKGADMPERVKMDFVIDSEIPTNTYVKRENTVQMLKESAGFGIPFTQLAKEEPRMAAWWAGQFPGVEIPLLNQTQLLIVCQDYIDKVSAAAMQATQSAQTAGFYPDPQQVAQEIVQSLQIPKSSDSQAIKADLIKDYLDSDEAKAWPPVQMAAVELLIQTLYENDSFNRMRIPAIDTAAQAKMAADAHQAMGGNQQPDPKSKLIESMAYKDAPPDIKRQMEEQAGFKPSASGAAPSDVDAHAKAHTAQMAGQNTGPQEDPNAEMKNEVAKRGLDEIQKESDANREEKKAQADHERQKELERLKNHGRSRPSSSGPGRRK
jgi:hypothetical protein